MKLSLLVSFVFFISNSTYALVDYTDSEDFTPKNSGAKRVSKPKARNNIVKRAAPKRAGQSSDSEMFQLGTSYSSMTVKTGEAEGKATVINFEAHFQTSFNIYLDANYYQGSSEQSFGLSKDLNTKGNPEVKLGFNWLELGGGADAATVDFIGGVSVGQQGSLFAHSRTDKIVGVETVKRFYQFALGLSYKLILTGNPDTDDEMSIGNISNLSASIGWVVSPDIRVVVEGGTTSISPSKLNDRENLLEEEISFGYIAPKLQLGITPSVNLDLGAVFRTKRLRDEKLISAKLWDLKGSYGNSIIAGLSFSM